MPARPEAEVDRVLGEPVVVLLAAEALLLHGGHELPVAQEGGRGVVEVAGDPEDVHQDCRCAWSAIGRGVRLPRPPAPGRAGADPERIPPPEDERERAQDHVVEDGEQDPRLEVADPVGHAGPPAPGGAERGHDAPLGSRCGSGRHSRSLA